MSGERFLEELRSCVLIGDGAIGTELVARGASFEVGLERLNIFSPDLVKNLHRDYVLAGSRVIETNTFGANRPSLARYGTEDRLHEIIGEGVRLAREAAESDTYIAGSVGPLPVLDGEPFSDTDRTAYFAEQITALLNSGVDLLIFESFADTDELVAAVSIARSITSVPIVAQSAFDSTGHNAGGSSAAYVGQHALKAGADVIGANCGYGVPSITASIRQMCELDAPMSAYMNAGFPDQMDNRLMYRSTPEYLARRAQDLVKMGVRLVGGCCGTGPDAIRAIAAAVCNESSAYVPVGAVSTRDETGGTCRLASYKQMESCRVLVELDPPVRPDLLQVLDRARILRDAGVDAITVADNPLASSRVDSLTTAVAIQQQCGITVIPHLTGRDRNKIALQSTVMGAYALGIRSILCITGDPVRMCQQPNTSGVFDVNSVGLVRLISDFNASLCEDSADSEPLSIGVALNPNVRTLSGQVAKMRRKIEAGANFALTQPVYSEDRLDALLEALDAEGIQIPVYVGVLPLTSLRNAEFVHNEVPGIYVPEALRELLAKYPDVKDQRAASIDFCVDFIQRLSSRNDECIGSIGSSSCLGVHGFYIIAPRNRVDFILPVIRAAKSGIVLSAR